MDSKNTVWVVVALLVVLGLGAWLYSLSGGSSNAPVPADTATPEPAPQNTVEVPATSNDAGGTTATQSPSEKNFTVTGQDYSFSPATLTVNKGDKVTLTFKNTDGMHDLKIDEFNVATKRIREGQEDTVTFTADKTGSFEYYCSVGSHRALGMKGTLTVQ